ncbi:Adenosine monophosphate-protein transferase SoFic [Pseudomonas sp. 37 R 15]|uniref:Fic family protein n=1 Tax=Pseudomonas sp. 37 R 15 TaxID=1844104 RepID=UPI000812873D|nr:Fic family protein [Pseudomonas sp. 37 R 15]CRM24823.1 Adenosine monophosphate-protein transferase SoFic [Pseudomonas sp. 37 R 15]CRM64665.1 Adenosine monophosphate-protein transferase SoFic [Pseudomonas sp. 37 R 15]
MSLVGYAHLHQLLGLKAIAPARSAMVKPVTRISLIGDCLAVPQTVAPAADSVLDHILFALKHEGINLAILAQALDSVSADQLLQELDKAPNGVFIRKACYLWEGLTLQRLDYSKPINSRVSPLFDPQRYVTGPSTRNSRWRIDFNGLGSLAYCATVERTSEIDALLSLDILGRAKSFMATLPPEMMDRAIQWAYLHETRDSFAIEKEQPSEEKSRRFVQLLRQAHEGRLLTEDYLVELQNSTVSNPFDKAVAFRHEQNHLHNGLRGAAGVSYVPPAPALCQELMEELMAFANQPVRDVDPLVAAAVTAFGFVFLHPFMDGNGRLSRFLIHQTLCHYGALGNGLLLPVSVAMKHEEQAYLEALKTFSQPTREFWNVTWLDADHMAFDFIGHPSIYRYWGATRCVEFTLQMARRALEVELREETEFLDRYDRVIKAVNQRYDVRGSDLSKLVMMCLDNEGKLSKHRRKQFQYSVAEEVFGFIEEEVGRVIEECGNQPSPI